MAKYFIQEGQPTITGETAHHLANVLRMKIGEKILLCNGASTDYLAVIDSINKHEVAFSILDSYPSNTEPPVFITLYQGLPKSDKLETIVQKSVELGVSKIVPVMTSRSIPKIKDSIKKTARLQKIAQSAAEQSNRGIIPVVCDAISFSSADKTKNVIVAYENENQRSFKSAITPGTKNLDIWIGPEGGFTQEEIATLVAQGGTTVSLGPRILRTETAAIASIAQAIYALE